jgi:group II intron reverse transcriptase/maturase
MVKYKTHLLRQRVRSTGLPERDLVIVKRKPYSTVADGKEPKSVRKFNQTLTAHSNNGDRTGPGTEVSKWYKRLTVLSRLEKHQRARSLWALINEKDLWAAAYQKLATSPGSLTRGGGKTTIDGYSMKILDALRNSVYNGTYTFGITRRVFIPKPQGGRRPLGVPEFRDTVVQEVIRSILEAVFEPRFHSSSHGFRPGRSQHTCMRQIRRDFRGVKWFIEGDISKCFDEINHESIRKELEKHIQDKRFVSLVTRGLRTKVLVPDRKLEDLTIGTPQGGICSPLLSNIALNKFDQFMARLKSRIDRGKKRKQNPEYIKAYGEVTRARRAGQNVFEQRRYTRTLQYGDPKDPEFLLLNYVRYADDFLIGITGPRALAERVRCLAQRFLKQKLKLKLNEDKTLITRAKGNKVPFLGFLIQTGPKISMIFKRRYVGKWRTVKSIRSGDLRLLVDNNKVIKVLANKKFCTQDGSPRPCFTYFQDPQSNTVAKAKSIIQGIDNYYQIANNRRAFTSRVVYIIRDSIARVFAAKFKLRTRRQVYAKGGKDLSRPIDAKTGKTAKGATDAQANAWAEEAGGRIKGSMPKIPYTKYGSIPKPTLAPLPQNWNPLHQSHTPYGMHEIGVRSGRGSTALERGLRNVRKQFKRGNAPRKRFER